MAECPSCGNTLTGKICACGYAVRPAVTQKTFSSRPQRDAYEAFNARLREVEAHVSDYQAEHPGATKRQACLAYLKNRGLEKMVPPHIREAVGEKQQSKSFDDVMDEYRAEVQA